MNTAVASAAAGIGEFLYDVEVRFTKVTEFGFGLDALVSGTIPLPPAGVRLDVAFEGTARGPRLNAHVSGIDYLYARADGRIHLHIHAQVTTDDGEKLAFFADGLARLRPGTGVADLRENGSFLTASARYAWLNDVQVWGKGTVDLAARAVQIRAYSA